jgi:hypothetical protein
VSQKGDGSEGMPRVGEVGVQDMVGMSQKGKRRRVVISDMSLNVSS